MSAILTIYRIFTLTISDNKYKINRDEEWIIKKVNGDFNESDAISYIINQSLEHTDLPKFIFNLSGEERTKAINDFCFNDDKYLKYRRFFIGYPPIDQIVNELKNDGIKILNTIKDIKDLK